jgi:Predicted integral membrane protein (DUF2269)
VFDALKTLHVLAIATWFGSGVAITVMGIRALKTGGLPYGSFIVNASAWAGRAHPIAGVILLLTGFGMVGDRDLAIGDAWILIGIIGLVTAMGIGGALIARTAGRVIEGVEQGDGVLPEDRRKPAERMLLYTRIELAVLAVVIAVMVVKPV